MTRGGAGGGGLSAEQRASLAGLARVRRDAKPPAASGDVASPQRSYAAQLDFGTLPGLQELKIQRAMAQAIGLENPFFRTHDVRAGERTRIDGRDLVNWSSYDYLGLNGHPDVTAAAEAALEAFGSSVSASRLVAGERPFHHALEDALARHYGAEACVAMVSGHATNVSTLSSLVGPGDLLVHDALAHNSILMGAQLSRAERRSFAHNDLDALEALLADQRDRFNRALIVVEGLYSMDGDFPDLPRLVALKRRYGAWLMVDDAHGLGVLGPTGAGLFEQWGVPAGDVDIWMGTLSKTLSSCGGYIAGPRDMVEFLKCSAGGFVYSVGLSPPLAAAAEAALGLLHREPGRVEDLRRNGRRFLDAARRRGLDTGSSAGLAVIPVLAGDSLVAVALGQRLFERGVNVQPIIYPAVPEKSARLRFFITARHTEQQIDATVAALADAVEEIGDGRALLSGLDGRNGRR